MISTSYSADISLNLKKSMIQPRYQNAIWGYAVEDLTTHRVSYQFNATKMFIPASVCKIFSVQALLNTFGYDYTFKTPLYALGKIDHGILNGDLVLVAKGDLTLGGRHKTNNQISYTQADHVDANLNPNAVLTSEDPLAGIKLLAKQVHDRGVHTLHGDVLVDTRLFETIKMRENVLSPIMINDNLIDVEVKPGKVGEKARLNWRPQISAMTVTNQVMTVSAEQSSTLHLTADASGNHLIVSGTIALTRKNLLNTFTIENPAWFTRQALIDALQQEGVTLQSIPSHLPEAGAYTTLSPIAVLTSEPLIESAKLILKVSHNVGANLIPLLLASYHNKTTYSEGMKYLNEFLVREIHIQPNEIFFTDAAGGNDNHATLETILKILTYIYQLPHHQFEKNLDTLPILGKDGSLTMIGQNLPAAGHVFAKTGTNVTGSMLNDHFLLTAKSLAGYMQLKNHHWAAFVIIVNGVPIGRVDDVLDVSEDLGNLADQIYQAR